MNTASALKRPRSGDLICRELSIPELVAEVYDETPAAEDRARLLQPLLAALGVLSLATVAGDVFSWLRPVIQDVGSEGAYGMDTLRRVRSSHVLELAERAQQVDPDVMVGLAGVMQASPALYATSAAALLMAVLARRGGARQKRSMSPAQGRPQVTSAAVQTKHRPLSCSARARPGGRSFPTTATSTPG